MDYRLAADPAAMTRTELDGKVVVLTDKYDGMRYNTPNDLTIDGKGRIYFSDPRYGDRKSMEMKDEKKRLMEELEMQMDIAAQNLEFEKAADLRDEIELLRREVG